MSQLGQEILARADVLRALSDDPHAYSRTYLTPAHRAAARQIASWMETAGMTVREDGFGNVIGRCACADPHAPVLLTGSHYDTVYNAGRYDGILGILISIAVLQTFHQRQEKLPFTVEVIAFAEEENVRFATSFLGSRGFIGEFDPAWLTHRDHTGVSLRDAFLAANLDPLAPVESRDWGKVVAYVEVHIEQGPTLLHENLPLGVVSSIAGASRYRVVVQGRSGHAGTVTMTLRKDALAAAAEMILAIEKLARGRTAELVATVGTLSIPDAAPNVIPGKVEFTLDLRSGDDEARTLAAEQITALLHDIAQRRGVVIEVISGPGTAAVPCEPWLTSQLVTAIAALGLPSRKLFSGAGHDAVVLSQKTDVALLFIRSGKEGISHHPDETVSVEDVALGTSAFMEFLRRFSPPMIAGLVRHWPK